MPKTCTAIPVFRPATPRWVVVGAAGCGGFMLSLVCSYNGVSPLWAVPVSLAVAHYTAKSWVRRRYNDVTAKPCPLCGKPPAMVLEVDGDQIEIHVWCRSRPACPAVGGVYVKATIAPGAERDDALRVACQRAANGWSADDLQNILRRQARD